MTPDGGYYVVSLAVYLTAADTQARLSRYDETAKFPALDSVAG